MLNVPLLNSNLKYLDMNGIVSVSDLRPVNLRRHDSLDY